MTSTGTLRQQGVRLALKRGIDIAGAGLAMTVLSPVMAVAYAAVRLSMGKPVLFRQARPGTGGKVFLLLKFRTMSDTRDASGHPLPDENRLTPTGRLLRSTAVDELPQLWNVLKGDMSLVGPRPLHIEYLSRYSADQARRHDVMPGITGWAQINGRNSLSWPDRFKLDLWYVDHWSLGLDLRILLRTPLYALRRVGVNAPGHATMPKFEGNPTGS